MKTLTKAQLVKQQQASDDYILVEGYDARDIQEFILNYYEPNCDNDHYIFSLANNYTVVILPVTGKFYWGISIKIKLKIYNYCPDARILTHKLLGRPSPGLPPPTPFVS